MVYLVLFLILVVVLILGELVTSDRALRRYTGSLEALAARTTESENRLRQKIFECKLLTQQLENKTAECNLLRQQIEQLKAGIVSVPQQVQFPAQPTELLSEIDTREAPQEPDTIEALQERVQVPQQVQFPAQPTELLSEIHTRETPEEP